MKPAGRLEEGLREVIARVAGWSDTGLSRRFYGRVGGRQSESIDRHFEGLRQRDQAVCLLQSQEGPSTAFLVGPTLALACNHSFVGGENNRRATKRDLAGASVTFDHDLREETQPFQVQVSADEPLVARRTLDFAAFSLERAVTDRSPIQMPEVVRIRLGADVFVIGHAAGQPKEFAFAENDVTRVRGEFIWYRADTLPGSSGAPVFDSRLSLVAMHRLYGKRRTYNEGVRADRITPFIRHLLAP
jgi:hypothetical protein